MTKKDETHAEDEEVEGEAVELERAPIERLGDLWERAWEGGGHADLALCCTVDVRYEDPLSGTVLEGTGALAHHVTMLRRAFPDLRVQTLGSRVADHTVGSLPWRMSGTHRGHLGEIPPTGRFMAMDGLHYVVLRDGLIASARGFYDLYDVMMQLGLLPKRGSLGESALMLLRGFGLRSRT